MYFYKVNNLIIAWGSLASITNYDHTRTTTSVTISLKDIGVEYSVPHAPVHLIFRRNRLDKIFRRMYWDRYGYNEIDGLYLS